MGLMSHIRPYRLVAVLGMKKLLYSACGLFIVALACVSFSGCSTSETTTHTSTTAVVPNANGGQLTIYRAANLGETLSVTIDGVARGQVRRGETFTTVLSPGQHVVSLLLQPNNLNLAPTVKKLTVEKGGSYAFTARWLRDTMLSQQ